MVPSAVSLFLGIEHSVSICCFPSFGMLSSSSIACVIGILVGASTPSRQLMVLFTGSNIWMRQIWQEPLLVQQYRNLFVSVQATLWLPLRKHSFLFLVTLFCFVFHFILSSILFVCLFLTAINTTVESEWGRDKFSIPSVARLGTMWSMFLYVHIWPVSCS